MNGERGENRIFLFTDGWMSVETEKCEGRWYALGQNAEEWFNDSRNENSYAFFTIAATLAAMEAWDLIGIPYA